MVVPAKPTTPILNTVDPAYLGGGLLLAMPLSDGTGTAPVDISGNGLDGTTQGLTQWVNDATLGTVLQLDGTSGYVQLNSTINTILAAQTSATVAMWVRLRNATPATVAKAGLITVQAMGGANAATLYPNPTDSKGYFSVFRTNTRFNAVALGATDRSQFHHVAVTQLSNGGSAAYIIYINGVSVGSTTAEFGVGATVSPPTFGRSIDSGGSYFLDGWLGDLRIWSRVLLPSEILTLFNNPWGLYTPSAQSAQVKAHHSEIEYTLEPSTALRMFAPQIEVMHRPAAAISNTLLMVDTQITTTFPYSISNGQDARYKPSGTPTLFSDTVTSGLKLALPLNEGTGTSAADYSGNANNGTLNGSAAWAADATSPFFFPSLVKAPDVSFSTNASFISVPANATIEPTTAFTLAAWVVTGANTGTNMVIMSKVNDPNGTNPNTGATWSYILWYGADLKFHLQMSDTTDSTPADTVATSSTFAASTLCHVVATFDNTAQLMKIYVNGLLLGSQANSGTIPYNSNGTHALHIGNDELASGEWRFSGRIDDVRIWNRALSLTEVQQLYNGPFGIYCNFAAQRTFDVQAEVNLEDQTALRLFMPQVEIQGPPPSAITSTVLMADVQLAVHNTNFGLGAISPVLGPVGGGTTVTVTGYNFANITQVLVGGVPLTSLTLVNSSTITGVTGVHAQGLVDVQVISSSFGGLTLPASFAYVPGFTNQAVLGIVGAQLDSSLILSNTYTGETAPLGTDTTLSFTLPDFPISPTCVDLTVRKVAQPGGVWMRQGAIYDYTVDMANKKIIWKGSTAAFALASGDEITVRALYQGN